MTSKLALYAIAVGMFAVLLFSVMPATSLAADDPDATKPTTSQIKLENPLGANATIPGVLKRIFNQLAWLLTFCIPIIIIVGAFQMMFSAGNPEKFAEGQKTITYAIIGYVIILMANGLISIVTKILTP
jgi:amino acid transporter